MDLWYLYCPVEGRPGRVTRSSILEDHFGWRNGLHRKGSGVRIVSIRADISDGVISILTHYPTVHKPVKMYISGFKNATMGTKVL